MKEERWTGHSYDNLQFRLKWNRDFLLDTFEEKWNTGLQYIICLLFFPYSVQSINRNTPLFLWRVLDDFLTLITTLVKEVETFVFK